MTWYGYGGVGRNKQSALRRMFDDVMVLSCGCMVITIMFVVC